MSEKKMLVKRTKAKAKIKQFVKKIEVVIKELTEAAHIGGETGQDFEYIKNNPENVKLVERHARKGNPQAQFWLGFFYIHGWGKRLDIQAGEKWLMRSADNGVIEAINWIGTTYRFEGNYFKAAKYFLDGAKKGCPKCMAEIARYYFRGTGVKQNKKEGDKWFMESAESGNVNAERELGLSYLNGNDMEKDPQKAIFWLTRAGNHGDLFAAEVLGMTYRYGDGDDFAQDLMACAHWYEKAWKNGSEIALESYLDVCRVIYSIRETVG